MSDSVRKVCGIVMPISAIEGYSASHWSDVKEIITDAIRVAGFDGILVSDADTSGVIHKRIVQNLYDNPVLVCDVSGKNPNVMFELGMRLAFDKPTIIVKDDVTPYSFDTASIEHLEYPKDLRFAQILAFKEKLRAKIIATFESSAKDASFSTFLRNFGQFKVAKLDETEISSQEFIIDEIKNLRLSIDRLAKRPTNFQYQESTRKYMVILVADGISIDLITAFTDAVKNHPGVTSVKSELLSDGHNIIVVETISEEAAIRVKNVYEMELPRLRSGSAL